MQFVYFLPGWKKPDVTNAELDAIDLGHVHGGVGVQAMLISGFGKSDALPGESGLLITAQDAAVAKGCEGRPMYQPAEQTWRAGPKRGDGIAWHVGYWNDSKPTERSLRRTKVIAGNTATLRDKVPWHVPIAYADSGMITLPKVLDLVDLPDGTQDWRGKAAPEYDEISRIAAATAETLLGMYSGQIKTVKFGPLMATVVAALQINYRIGPVELAMLGLVGDAEAFAVAEALCDWGTFRKIVEEELVKNDPASAAAGTANGSGATCSADGDPPSETSPPITT